MSNIQLSQDKANVNLTSSQAILNLSLAAKNFYNANDHKTQKACADLALKLMCSEGGLQQDQEQPKRQATQAEEPVREQPEPQVHVEVRTGIMVDREVATKMGLGHLTIAQLKDFVSQKTGVPASDIEVI